MNKPIEKWHLILTAVSLLVTFSLIVIKQAQTITTLQQQIISLNEAKLYTNSQLEKINSTLVQILVEMQNKQDRK